MHSAERRGRKADTRWPRCMPRPGHGNTARNGSGPSPPWSAQSGAKAWGHEPPAPKDQLPMLAYSGDCSGESGDVAAAPTEAQVCTTRALDHAEARQSPIRIGAFYPTRSLGPFCASYRALRTLTHALTDPACQHRLRRSNLRKFEFLNGCTSSVMRA